MIRSRQCAVFLGFFCAAYIVIQRSGILASKRADYDQIFFLPPFLAGATLLAFCLVVTVTAGRIPREKRQWLLLSGIILMLAGLWTSYLTRIDEQIVVTEGQSVGINRHNIRLFSGYAGKLARFPEFYFKLERLTPEFSPDRKTVKSLVAEYMLLTDDGKPPRRVKKASTFPAMRSGFIVSFSEFGYSPRYVLKGAQGEELDTAFVALKLFPQGKEDYFRLLSPHTYYVRYYSGGGDAKEASFNLRIARNKDLVLNRQVKVNEDIKFEGNNFSFAEVKQWTKFRVVRDPGYLLWPAGILVTAIGLIASWRSRKNCPEAECQNASLS
jgi:hypothetical protein